MIWYIYIYIYTLQSNITLYTDAQQHQTWRAPGQSRDFSFSIDGRPQCVEDRTISSNNDNILLLLLLLLLWLLLLLLLLIIITLVILIMIMIMIQIIRDLRMLRACYCEANCQGRDVGLGPSQEQHANTTSTMWQTTSTIFFLKPFRFQFCFCLYVSFVIIRYVYLPISFSFLKRPQSFSRDPRIASADQAPADVA